MVEYSPFCIDARLDARFHASNAWLFVGKEGAVEGPCREGKLNLVKYGCCESCYRLSMVTRGIILELLIQYKDDFLILAFRPELTLPYIDNALRVTTKTAMLTIVNPYNNRFLLRGLWPPALRSWSKIVDSELVPSSTESTDSLRLFSKASFFSNEYAACS